MVFSPFFELFRQFPTFSSGLYSPLCFCYYYYVTLQCDLIFNLSCLLHSFFGQFENMETFGFIVAILKV